MEYRGHILVDRVYDLRGNQHTVVKLKTKLSFGASTSGRRYIPPRSCKFVNIDGNKCKVLSRVKCYECNEVYCYDMKDKGDGSGSCFHRHIYTVNALRKSG